MACLRGRPARAASSSDRSRAAGVRGRGRQRVTALLVALGAAVGAPAAARRRPLPGLATASRAGTLLVNVVGLDPARRLLGARPVRVGAWHCSARASAAGSRRTPRSRCKAHEHGWRVGDGYAARRSCSVAAGLRRRLRPRVRAQRVAQVVQPVVVDAEVVRDLVDDGDPDLLLQLVDGVAHGQQRVAEDQDPVGQ